MAVNVLVLFFIVIFELDQTMELVIFEHTNFMCAPQLSFQTRESMVKSCFLRFDKLRLFTVTDGHPQKMPNVQFQSDVCIVQPANILMSFDFKFEIRVIYSLMCLMGKSLNSMLFSIKFIAFRNQRILIRRF